MKPNSRRALKNKIRISLDRTLLTHLRSLWLPTFKIEGKTAGGESLTLLYAGTDAERMYLKSILFPDGAKQQRLGRHFFWQIDPLATKLGADIQVSVATYITRFLFPSEQHFYIPTWLECEASIEKTSVTIGTTKSRRRQIKQLLKHNMHYSVTRDLDDLMHFYERMYKPLISQSHGGNALMMKADHMLERVTNGEGDLVLIHQGDDTIAGSLIVYDKGQPRLFSEGILDADKRYMRQGVGSAIYLFSFQYLIEKGFSRVNLGRCRAFVNDGVFYFKKRFGLEIIGELQKGMLLKNVSNSPASIKILSSNPFVYLKGGKRFIAHFLRKNIDSNSDATPDSENDLDLSVLGVEDVVAITPANDRVI